MKVLHKPQDNTLNLRCTLAYCVLGFISRCHIKHQHRYDKHPRFTDHVDTVVDVGGVQATITVALDWFIRSGSCFIHLYF